MSLITGLDHVIIAVEDLEGSEAAIRRLGFLTTPVGVHSPHKGTANLTAVFSDRSTYFELLGVVHPTPINARVRAGLQEGRHLLGIVLKTGDAAAAAEAFAAAGIGEGGLNAFSRPVEMPGGTQEASFRTTFVSSQGALGLFVFACEHLTPEAVWREGYVEHPNAVVAIDEVVGVASDLAAMEAAWSRIAPDVRRSRLADRLLVALGNARVTFMDPAAYAGTFGELPGNDPDLGALVMRTADPAAVRKVLSGGGVRFDDDGTLLRVPPREALGVTFAFRRA